MRYVKPRRDIAHVIVIVRWNITASTVLYLVVYDGISSRYVKPRRDIAHVILIGLACHTTKPPASESPRTACLKPTIAALLLHVPHLRA